MLMCPTDTACMKALEAPPFELELATPLHTQVDVQTSIAALSLDILAPISCCRGGGCQRNSSVPRQQGSGDLDGGLSARDRETTGHGVGNRAYLE